MNRIKNLIVFVLLNGYSDSKIFSWMIELKRLSQKLLYLTTPARYQKTIEGCSFGYENPFDDKFFNIEFHNHCDIIHSSAR